jgi:hypothetical protein
MGVKEIISGNTPSKYKMSSGQLEFMKREREKSEVALQAMRKETVRLQEEFLTRHIHKS